MSLTKETAVASIVTEHPVTSRVFERHHIDYCCGGGVSLGEACAERGLDLGAVLDELEHALDASSGSAAVRWDERPLSELIEYIVAKYHDHLRVELPRIEVLTRKVRGAHGNEDADRLGELASCFAALAAELEPHMAKEERILFPMILRGEGQLVRGPVAAIEADHDRAGALLARLRELTDDYRVPDWACPTTRALWAALEHLEHELHEHIHLENNVLHRRALAEERG